MHLGKKLQRRLALSAVLGAVVFVLLAVFGDVRRIGASLADIRWALVPGVFGLALGNYAVRFIRWSYYLRRLEIGVSFRESVTVFMSGLALSITPGKMGELVKAYFLKQINGTPVRKTVAVVFAERYTDFFAIVVLAAAGSLGFRHGRVVIWIGAAITVAMLVAVMNRAFMLVLVGRLSRSRRLRKPGDALLALYDHAYALLRPQPLSIALVLGLAAWFCECLGLLVTVSALGYTMGMRETTFIYAFSTLFGAVTLLPGGLGTTEGSLAGLLLLRGIPRATASAATILIRIATLWFAVFLGFLWLSPNRRLVIPDREELEAYER